MAKWVWREEHCFWQRECCVQMPKDEKKSLVQHIVWSIEFSVSGGQQLQMPNVKGLESHGKEFDFI